MRKYNSEKRTTTASSHNRNAILDPILPVSGNNRWNAKQTGASMLFGLKIATVTAILAFSFLLLTDKNSYALTPQEAPTIDQLNKGISTAETYYEGLYRDMGNGEAVVAEYYSGNKSVYTVRHGVMGGVFYYNYTGNATRSAALAKFAHKYGFNPSYDDHAFAWEDKTDAPTDIVYSLDEYHDCDVSLPQTAHIFPYHSKVCKLGLFGEIGYLILSRFDTLSPIETTLENLDEGKSVPDINYQEKYNQLGFGVPICTIFKCDPIASTIRTAQFGVLELRLGKMEYADTIAYDLLKAQASSGAIYISYDKNFHYNNSRNFPYNIINLVMNGKPFYNGFVPTNAETMNDSLAFLLQYRCQKYGVCGK